MKWLHRWTNNRANIIFVIALMALAVSGWVAYHYAYQSGLRMTKDSDSGSREVAHSGCSHERTTANCGGCGMGGVEGKLAMIGQMTLAGDAVRRHLQKETQGKAQVELRDMKIDAPGIVLVTARVNGKERSFRVDLSVPQGKVEEVPLTKTSPPSKEMVKVPAKGS
jgi:hypothetical protein